MQAEPNWTEMYEWARNMARRMINGRYREDGISDLVSAAVCHLCEVWTNYRHLPDAEWKRVVSAILRNAMLGALKKEHRDSGRFFIPPKESETVNCRPKQHVSVEGDVEDPAGDGGMEMIEERVDFERESKGFLESLTPSERRVLPEWVENPSATSDEVAVWAGFPTGGAVRIHETNIRGKLSRSFPNTLTKRGGKVI